MFFLHDLLPCHGWSNESSYNQTQYNKSVVEKLEPYEIIQFFFREKESNNKNL